VDCCFGFRPPAVAVRGAGEVEPVCVLLDERDVGLLRDQHRGARMAKAEGRDPRGRVVVSRDGVSGEARGEAVARVFGGDRAEVVKAAESVQRGVEVRLHKRTALASAVVAWPWRVIRRVRRLGLA
jgi:hypothetical protein